jgi:hypothetical protein
MNHYDELGGTGSYIDYANLVVATQYIGPIYTTQAMAAALPADCFEATDDALRPLPPIQPGDGTVALRMTWTPRQRDSGVSLTMLQNFYNNGRFERRRGVVWFVADSCRSMA